MNLEDILKAKNKSLPIQKLVFFPKKKDTKNDKNGDMERNFFRRDGIRTRMIVVTDKRSSLLLITKRRD